MGCGFFGGARAAIVLEGTVQCNHRVQLAMWGDWIIAADCLDTWWTVGKVGFVPRFDGWMFINQPMVWWMASSTNRQFDEWIHPPTDGLMNGFIHQRFDEWIHWLCRRGLHWRFHGWIQRQDLCMAASKVSMLEGSASLKISLMASMMVSLKVWSTTSQGWQVSKALSMDAWLHCRWFHEDVAVWLHWWLEVSEGAFLDAEFQNGRKKSNHQWIDGGAGVRMLVVKPATTPKSISNALQWLHQIEWLIIEGLKASSVDSFVDGHGFSMVSWMAALDDFYWWLNGFIYDFTLKLIASLMVS